MAYYRHINAQETPLNAQQIISALDRGELDPDLESILLAAYRRKGDRRYSPTAAQVAAKPFAVGARVVFNRLTQPRYLVGLGGTVTKVNDKTVKVVLDEASRERARRFGGDARPIGCPKTIVDVL